MAISMSRGHGSARDKRLFATIVSSYLVLALAGGCVGSAEDGLTPAPRDSRAPSADERPVGSGDPARDADSTTHPDTSNTETPSAANGDGDGPAIDEPDLGEANADRTPAGDREVTEPAVTSPSTEAPAEQLPALPNPREGVCAFEPLPDPAMQVDNPNCPDGIWHGDLSLDSDAATERARGCTRVTGRVDVFPFHITSLAALHELRVIEGEVIVDWDGACLTEPSCVRATPEFSSLDGLDNLRCVGGSLNVYEQQRPLDVSALRNLVEVGGTFQLHVDGVPDETLASLRRVWSDMWIRNASAAPRLESVYGRYHVGNEPAQAEFYVGCAGGEYCRDGVLGCSYDASTPEQLQLLSKCEIAVANISVTGTAVADLSPLAKLRHAKAYLSIHGVTDSAAANRVETLSGLESLETVGNLSIHSLASLRSLEGLSNVSMNGGRVELLGLPALQNLRGLSEIETLDRLEISHCDALRDLTGLDSLRELGVLSLQENAALQSLDGIPALRRARNVTLAWNPKLEDISALSSIEAMNLTLWDLMSLSDLSPLAGVTLYDVHVVKLPLLGTLAGLEGVGTRPSRIDIQQNTLLADISAISHLQYAKEVLILYNPSLESLDALSNLVSSPYGSIDHNALLPQCEVDALIARLPGIRGSQNDLTATCTP